MTIAEESPAWPGRLTVRLTWGGWDSGFSNWNMGWMQTPRVLRREPIQRRYHPQVNAHSL